MSRIHSGNFDLITIAIFSMSQFFRSRFFRSVPGVVNISTQSNVKMHTGSLPELWNFASHICRASRLWRRTHVLRLAFTQCSNSRMRESTALDGTGRRDMGMTWKTRTGDYSRLLYYLWNCDVCRFKNLWFSVYVGIYAVCVPECSCKRHLCDSRKETAQQK